MPSPESPILAALLEDGVEMTGCGHVGRGIGTAIHHRPQKQAPLRAARLEEGAAQLVGVHSSAPSSQYTI